MLLVLEDEQWESMVIDKMIKYLQQFKIPSTLAEGQTGESMNNENDKIPGFNVQYFTLSGYENADPCDDPEYVKAMYGKGGIYGPKKHETDEEEGEE